MRRSLERIVVAAAFLCTLPAGADEIEEVPDWRVIAASPVLTSAERAALTTSESALKKELEGISAGAASLNADCGRIKSTDAAKLEGCKARKAALQNRIAAYPSALATHAERIRAETAEWDAWRARVLSGESEYFYALQTRTLTPMNDGGSPIDAEGTPAPGMHGLVGGTTWTYGFQWPRKECDAACQKEVAKQLQKQLELHCSSQSDPKACLAAGLPFTKENYDFVVSMGSAHSAVEDLATRVLWDGPSFGEFSRKNKEIFASLKGREFETLDCHSNGAMLCLAALRSGDTKAKEVRLFGPQINKEAAARWREYAAATGAKITIYINNGDPIAAASWKQPAPATPIAKAKTAAVWLTNPAGTGAAAVSDALFHTWLDSKTGVMDTTLASEGFEVKRFFNSSDGCKGSPDIACHSMLLYEKNLEAAAKPAAAP